MRANLRHISEELFAAVGSPRRLEADRVRLNAWLTINAAAAREGRPQPGGDALFAVGTEREIGTALAVAKSLPAGGLFVVEFSPVGDGVRVVPLSDVEARGRAALAHGKADAAGWYPVWIGEREHCEREATRLRRVRAGRRPLEAAVS